MTLVPPGADQNSRGTWLLISVSTPSSAASLRVHVWRKLRGLGALYLQASVCLLPAREAVVREVRRLADRVRHDGGTARVLSVRLAEADECAVREELDAARDAEYAEVLDRVPAFAEELASERAKGRATYAEVEESEADLERFRSWLAKIQARDYFGAPGGAEARAAIERCAQDLAAFEAEALAAEAPPTRSRRLHPLPAASTEQAARARRPPGRRPEGS